MTDQPCGVDCELPAACDACGRFGCAHCQAVVASFCGDVIGPVVATLQQVSAGVVVWGQWRAALCPPCHAKWDAGKIIAGVDFTRPAP